jgi:hypothetical protein
MCELLLKFLCSFFAWMIYLFVTVGYSVFPLSLCCGLSMILSPLEFFNVVQWPYTWCIYVKNWYFLLMNWFFKLIWSDLHCLY